MNVAAKEILSIEAGGFAMLVASLLVLALGFPAAARLGRQQTATFRRTGVFYGVLLLGLLFGTVFVIGVIESH